MVASDRAQTWSLASMSIPQSLVYLDTLEEMIYGPIRFPQAACV